MAERYKSTKQRIREIQKIVMENYEVGDQKKCYKAIWRRIIYPRYKICYDTMLDYLAVKKSELNE